MEQRRGPAGKPASRLREELGHAGISATVSLGFGLALVMADQVNVWVEFGPQGWGFRWWTGRVSDRGLWDYTFCPASAVERVVRLIGARVREVRRKTVSVRELGRLQLAAQLADAAPMVSGVRSALQASEDALFGSERCTS